MKVPRFQIVGTNDPRVFHSIQPEIPFRAWDELSQDEKETALKYLENRAWTGPSVEITLTIEYLNHQFLRICPGRHLHNAPNITNHRHRRSTLNSEAEKDFREIFLTNSSSHLVMVMLSRLAYCQVNHNTLKAAEETSDTEYRDSMIENAYATFDRFARDLNHVFEQFAVNQVVTRTGFIPRQDEHITSKLYEPTFKSLSDPKWAPVNNILTAMFRDYSAGQYSEAITKAHSAVHCFLQIAVDGDYGKNSRGEVGILFRRGKKEGLISVNRFSEPYLNIIQSFISSERATNSTAKPATEPATNKDALFMMNITMVFLQYCRQT